jgi:aspartate aminotransferase
MPGRIPSASPTLSLNEEIKRLGDSREILHLGFGESPLPVLPSLREALERSSARNGYGPVAGAPALRTAIAGHFERRGIPASAECVVAGVGSKALLFSILAAIPGELILPRPAWVSYRPQGVLLGKRVRAIPTSGDGGGIPDPEALEAYLARRHHRGTPLVLVTQPDNPTGTVAPPELIEALVGVARRHGALIVCDQIYADLVYDAVRFVSPAHIAEEITIVTTGLSKSLSVGGWRIGAARFPDTDQGRSVRDGVIGAASEIWSCLPEPMTLAAQVAFEDGDDITQRLRQARALFAAVSRSLHTALLQGDGVACPQPQAAFYLYPRIVAARRRELAGLGVSTSHDLATAILQRSGVAVLWGEAFGDRPSALTFRVSTSLLVGDEDTEMLAALADPTPASDRASAAGVRLREAIVGLVADA